MITGSGLIRIEFKVGKLDQFHANLNQASARIKAIAEEAEPDPHAQLD